MEGDTISLGGISHAAWFSQCVSCPYVGSKCFEPTETSTKAETPQMFFGVNELHAHIQNVHDHRDPKSVLDRLRETFGRPLEYFCAFQDVLSRETVGHVLRGYWPQGHFTQESWSQAVEYA